MTGPVRLVLLAAAFLSGEIAGFACGRFADIWPAIAAVCIWLAVAAFGRNATAHVLPLVFFLAGVVLAMRTDSMRTILLETHWNSRGPDGVPLLALRVEGEVNVRKTRKGVTLAEFPSSLGPVPLLASIPVDGIARIPAHGEVWRCPGWISRKTMHPGALSRRYFRGKTGMAPELASEASCAIRFLDAFSAACIRRAGIGLDWSPKLAGLNRAILFGMRSGLSAGQRSRFADAGTVHVFAISGLHVMLMTLMLHRALSFLPVPFRARGLIALPLLAFYVAMTGLRPSAVRAGLMAALCLCAPAAGRKADMAAAWALAAIAVYGHAPQRLFDAGCNLSFLVMFGIAAWIKWVVPCLPERFAEKESLNGLGISAVAWVSGVPLVARVFGSVSLGGIPANLAVVKFAGYAVAFGMAGVVAGFFLPPAAALFNCIAAGAVYSMVVVSAVAAEIPWLHFKVEPWSFASCAAWYMAGAAAIAVFVRMRRSRMDAWWR